MTWVLKRGAAGIVVDGVAHAAHPAEAVRRHDRRRRRARGRVPRRRARARTRCGRPLRRPTRLAAVSELVVVSEEVRAALDEGRAVVALETTLVAHGFPAPEGVDVGLESERRVRAAGAVPATVGVLDGRVRIGLAADDLHAVHARRTEVRRARPRRRRRAGRGRRDHGRRHARGRRVGRHPLPRHGWPRRRPPWLPLPARRLLRPAELVRTPALVACSGVKSLLDVPATAEVLETLGVPLLGWRVDTLPLFYAAEGGPPVSARVETAAEAAALARRTLGARRRGTPARPPARREPRGRGADRGGRRRGEAAGDRLGRRDAVRARAAARAERGSHARRQPGADRRERRARRRGRGRARRRGLTES